MKIQILSDLHNEFLRYENIRSEHHWNGRIAHTDADVIVLAGDIDNGTQGIEWAVRESERLSKPILYVPGNHEYYYHEYSSVRKALPQKCVGSNVHCLDCGVFVSADVRIIGATLWTDYELNTQIPAEVCMGYAENYLPDHRMIKFKSADGTRGFMPLHARTIHKQELHWIEQQLKKPFEGKTVVVTHHGPHPCCQHPGFPMSGISGAFNSDLSAVLEQYDIDLWLCGHTHSNLDVVVSGTRIISNQAGHAGENVQGFDAKLVVTI